MVEIMSNLEKMRMESLNMTLDNISKIEAIFPNCITEAKDENGNPKASIFPKPHRLQLFSLISPEKVVFVKLPRLSMKDITFMTTPATLKNTKITSL